MVLTLCDFTLLLSVRSPCIEIAGVHIHLLKVVNLCSLLPILILLPQELKVPHGHVYDEDALVAFSLM